MTGAVVRVAETGSTNADLLALSDWPEGRWLLADRQTSGRGRLGRDWRSPAGNLHASTIVAHRPGDPPAPSLALLTGVAVAEALALFLPAGIEPLLKWPNDVLLDGVKCAGVLLERAGYQVVVGVGTNLTHAPELLDRDTACLADHSPPPTAPVFAEALAERFAAWLGRWRGEGVCPVRARWLALAHPLGTAVSVAESGETGLFAGLAEDGALRLRRADGTVGEVRAGDVRLAA